MAGSTKSLWLIDGYNVLRVSLGKGSPPTSSESTETTEQAERKAPAGKEERIEREPWWSQSRREYLESLAATLGCPDAEICVVFDARHLSEAQDQQSSGENSNKRVRVVFAPSADEWIVSTVKSLDDTRRSDTRVVTADRVLANRVRSRGVTVVATDEFVARCQKPPNALAPR